MDNVIKFEDLEVEVLIGIANESAELVEASARKTVEHAERCGKGDFNNLAKIKACLGSTQAPAAASSGSTTQPNGWTR
jgi:hypothetical protein